MSTFRLTFDFEVPDDISDDDREELSGWLDHFIGCVEDDILSCHPSMDFDIEDVNSDWEEI